MVDMLAETDRFSILAFSSGVQTFQSDMILATPENVDAAHTFINTLSEAGLTNYEDAFKDAFSCTWTDSSVNVIVFFTDGKPTWPVETSSTRILSLIKELNTKDVSIFSFGVGEDLDEQFLQSLAVQNSGAYYPIVSDNSIAPMLSGFMKRISYPLLKNIAVNYGTISEYDVFPRTLPHLFAGSQLSILGRFRNKGTSTVSVSGQRADEMVILQGEIQFNEALQSHPFIPRMWASVKIDYLLGEITLMGEQQELVDNVKQLGKKYSIITPYTSMLVIEQEQNTAIEDKVMARPDRFSFTAALQATEKTVTFRYAIPKGHTPYQVTLRIFNAQGRLLRKLVNEKVMGGNYMVRWDCMDNSGRKLSSGCYFAVLEVGKYRKMIPIQLTK
jgi:Ca-activated chloride channel family protein